MPISKSPTGQTLLYGSGGPRLNSRIITIRVGRSSEPDIPLLDDPEETSDVEEDENESDSHHPVPASWPELSRDVVTQRDDGEEDKDKDTSGSGVDSDYRNHRKEAGEEQENCHDTSYIQFLLRDELEHDYSDNDEIDIDYKYESAEEDDEEHDDVDMDIGFADAFYMHEDVLRSSSKFFDAALHEHWKECASGKVDVPCVDPEVFAIYAKWLYTGHLYLTGAANEPSPPSAQMEGPTSNTVAERAEWMECYKAGDYLQDADFRDALIDAAVRICSRAKDKCFALGFGSLFEYTTAASPHREFVIEMCVAGLQSSDKVQDIAKSVTEGINSVMAPVLLVAYAKCVIEKYEPVRPWEVADMCVYHEHTVEGGKCYKEKRGYKP